MHRVPPDPSSLPLPPSEPKLVNVTKNSIAIAWNHIRPKQGEVFIGYMVEYFSPDLQRGWILAAQRVPNNVITVCIFCNL